MSSASSVTDGSTTSSIQDPEPGILWVNVAVKNDSVTPEMVEDWYGDHISDILTSEGNGGLFLRYHNVSHSIASDAEMAENLASRLSPSSAGNEVSKIDWPYLAVVRVLDLQWYHSSAFHDIPLASTKLNTQPGGEPVSAFDVFYAALRSYVRIDESFKQGEEWPKYFVAVQMSSVEETDFNEVDNSFKSIPEYRGFHRFKSVDGHLAAQEAGKVPVGLVMYHFDGESPPKLPTETFSGVVKQDVWRLVVHRGDSGPGI